MTFVEALHDHTKSRPKSIAFIVGEDVWTYERLTAEVECVARGLARLGLREGNRVVLHMLNTAELVVAYYACLCIGAIVAPLNTRLKAAELRPLLERLQPALYIGHADLYRHIAAMDASIIPLKARYIVGGSPVNDPCVQPWRRLLENCAVDHAPLAPDVHSPAVLLATSGTTGQPKFAIHTKATLSAITASARQMGLDDRQIAMIALPLVQRVWALYLSGVSSRRHSCRLAGAV